MGDLAEAVATVVRQPVELTGAGRTDAGVHAWGQVVSGDLPAEIDLADLARRLNKLCAPAIAVRDAAWVDDDFDARFSATWRHYRYDVWNAVAPNPLLAGRAWFVPHPLALLGDAGGLRPADRPARLLLVLSPPAAASGPDGEAVEPSLVRRVLQARWSELDDPRHLRFEIRATAFCHQMVRSIVGTLVDVGIGRSRPATCAASSSPATATPPARSPRPTASSSGRSATPRAA